MGKYEDLLKLADRQQETYGVPAAPAPNQMQGLLQNLAAIAMQNGNPNTERGQIFQSGGQAYLGAINARNRQDFFNKVRMISATPGDPGQKIQMLAALQAEHGTDYGLGLNDIMKQFSDIRQQNVTMRGQNMDRAAKGPVEWKPRTQQEAMDFESAKAGMKPPSQGQETTALYASRIKQANDVLGQIESFINNQGPKEMMQAGLPKNGFTNWLKSEDMQSYEQAQSNFLNAVLRRESGAVISPSEFAEGRRQYFPQPGDKPAVIAQKKANRDLVMKNFVKAAGRAYVPYEQTDNPPGRSGGDITAQDALAELKRRGLING